MSIIGGSHNKTERYSVTTAMMNAFRLPLWCSLMSVSCALAQSDLHIGYVYPAGGRQGTTFQATIGGQHLNFATNIYVSGSGVCATIIAEERQLSPQEQDACKEKLSRIQEKRKQGVPLTRAEVALAEELKEKLTRFGRRLTNPSLGEFITLQVSVAANAQAGAREMRVQTRSGFSNPLIFMVGQLPEFSKPDWKNVPKSKLSMEPQLDPLPTENTVALPVTVNGQIPPGGVDRFRFPGRAGQHVAIAVCARALIPYIADAVPGWFQAMVALYDTNGRKLADSDHGLFYPDPVLFYTIPTNGDYVFEIKDALYRGREDFVYRITVGELPYITGVFPLGGRIGTKTTVALEGWNLPARTLTLDLANQPPGIWPFFQGHAYNTAPFELDTLPECFEREPNNAATNAQSVAQPVIINGRIGEPGDLDVYRISGKAGDQIVAEIHARRLNSPLDSVLSISHFDGTPFAINDDHEDKGSGLNTHHADSYLLITLPAPGVYFVQVGDAQQAGGRAYSYRLRISAPRPDFELRVVPSSLGVRGGASTPLTVYALRKDGFQGHIALCLTNAPEGFTVALAVIPEHQDRVRLTLDALPLSTTEPFTLHIDGSAMIQGRTRIRRAVPADNMMQAFAYRHLVPAQEQVVTVVGRFKSRDSARVLTSTPVIITAGGTARIQVSVPTGPMIANLEFELDQPPEGIVIKTVAPTSQGSEIVLQTDAAKVKAGMKDHLIINVFGVSVSAAESTKTSADNRRIPLGALPAIPFAIE